MVSRAAKPCSAPKYSRLWATHLVDEVRDGDAVVVLHHGRIVARGSAREVAETASAADLVSAFSRLTADTAEGVAAQ